MLALARTFYCKQVTKFRVFLHFILFSSPKTQRQSRRFTGLRSVESEIYHLWLRLEKKIVQLPPRLPAIYALPYSWMHMYLYCPVTNDPKSWSYSEIGPTEAFYQAMKRPPSVQSCLVRGNANICTYRAQCCKISLETLEPKTSQDPMLSYQLSRRL